MKRFWFLVSFVATILLSSCSGSVRESRLRNFWSDFDFSVDKAIDDMSRLETKFADYCELLSEVSEEAATGSIVDFVDKLSGNEILFYVCYEMFCGGLYSIESPFRNERLFDVYLKEAKAADIFKDYELGRINEMYRLSRLAREGERISDLEIFSLDRESHRLHDVLAQKKQTLLLVVDPNCPYCLDLIEVVEKDRSVARRVAKGELQMALLASVPDFGAMRNVCDGISSDWITFVAGADLDNVLDRQLSPAYYLIDDSAVVARKASDKIPVF